MKLKAAITQGTPDAVVSAFASSAFASTFLEVVVGEDLGVDDASGRPAEFYVQRPDMTVAVSGNQGVELRLTGVSRGNRTPEQLHKALQRLHQMAATTIKDKLTKGRVQLFCVIMLDNEIETAPRSGEYSSVLEHPAEWIQAGQS